MSNVTMPPPVVSEVFVNGSNVAFSEVIDEGKLKLRFFPPIQIDYMETVSTGRLSSKIEKSAVLQSISIDYDMINKQQWMSVEGTKFGFRLMLLENRTYRVILYTQFYTLY